MWVGFLSVDRDPEFKVLKLNLLVLEGFFYLAQICNKLLVFTYQCLLLVSEILGLAIYDTDMSLELFSALGQILIFLF